MRITYIVLDKDRPAVGFAECHGLGLIPYCQENKRLLVERKVDLWRNAFHTTTAYGGIYELRRRYYNSQWGITTPTVLATKYISHTVAVWIMEASELRAAGMPPGCFTLTFKGDPVCSDIFQTVVIRDAAWQLAMEKCFERGILPKAMHPKSPYFWTSNNSWYIFDGFPRAIQDMLDKTSVVKCAFDLGVGIDVENLIEGKLAACADLKVWEEGWSIRERNYLEPHRPLPSWDSLLWENCTQWWQA
ncbi:hypothetical protein CPLU01_15258 [Colletotrichum plurivorum]|uniref:Uncharacterized protein n=1 Tax=Colletotrichum plurivorum TaxID=2175906 RepID=A0A8H6JDG7_9PEZI|nr:hypothetical protein CPLU01_15258 [Colletotrichum plurivorum]